MEVLVRVSGGGYDHAQTEWVRRVNGDPIRTSLHDAHLGLAAPRSR